MRKLGLSLLVVSIILLMVSPSSAQTSRNPTSSEGKTGFTNIAVTGLNNDGTDGTVQMGTPGYIEMTSSGGDIYNLYVGYDGQLRIASEVFVGYLASPATVGWSDASGPVVGNQS